MTDFTPVFFSFDGLVEDESHSLHLPFVPTVGHNIELYTTEYPDVVVKGKVTSVFRSVVSSPTAESLYICVEVKMPDVRRLDATITEQALQLMSYCKTYYSGNVSTAITDTITMPNVGDDMRVDLAVPSETPDPIFGIMQGDDITTSIQGKVTDVTIKIFRDSEKFRNMIVNVTVKEDNPTPKTDDEERDIFAEILGEYASDKVSGMFFDDDDDLELI